MTKDPQDEFNSYASNLLSSIPAPEKGDWADEIADAMFDPTSKDYTHYPDRETIAAALRQAKQDGILEGTGLAIDNTKYD